jgi:hypothetical protein
MFESLTTIEKIGIVLLVALPIPADLFVDALYYYAGIDLIFY